MVWLVEDYDIDENGWRRGIVWHAFKTEFQALCWKEAWGTEKAKWLGEHARSWNKRAYSFGDDEKYDIKWHDGSSDNDT